eukprot:364869-Chlamydomonas_euryale.AAC.23
MEARLARIECQAGSSSFVHQRPSPHSLPLRALARDKTNRVCAETQAQPRSPPPLQQNNVPLPAAFAAAGCPHGIHAQIKPWAEQKVVQNHAGTDNKGAKFNRVVECVTCSVPSNKRKDLGSKPFPFEIPKALFVHIRVEECAKFQLCCSGVPVFLGKGVTIHGNVGYPESPKMEGMMV